MKQTNKFSSNATKRTYQIRSKATLNCSTSWCIYFATCQDCPEAGYVGQTYAAATSNSKGGLYKRHCGHRADSKAGKGGLGGHYYTHHGGSVETMVLTIIDTVEPGNHVELDRKEEAWIYRLKTLDTMGHGGLNSRDELSRNNKDRARLACTCITCSEVRGVKRRTPGD